MKKFWRTIAVILVVASIVSSLPLAAFANSSWIKTNNGYIIVETGKSPWYTHAKITIDNYDTNLRMKVTVKYASTGKTLHSITIPADGSRTLNLRDNQKFIVSWQPASIMYGSITGSITADQYINNMYKGANRG